MNVSSFPSSPCSLSSDQSHVASNVVMFLDGTSLFYSNSFISQIVQMFLSWSMFLSHWIGIIFLKALARILVVQTSSVDTAWKDDLIINITLKLTNSSFFNSLISKRNIFYGWWSNFLMQILLVLMLFVNIWLFT